jgi:hypothetical protein
MILFWKYLDDIISKAWQNLFWEHINGKLFAVWLQRTAERGLGYIHMNVSHRRIYWKEQKENMHVSFSKQDSEKWPVSQC